MNPERTPPPTRHQSTAAPPPRARREAPAEPFAAVLDQHQARTATAEGRRGSHDRPRTERAERAPARDRDADARGAERVPARRPAAGCQAHAEAGPADQAAPVAPEGAAAPAPADAAAAAAAAAPAVAPEAAEPPPVAVVAHEAVPVPVPELPAPGAGAPVPPPPGAPAPPLPGGFIPASPDQPLESALGPAPGAPEAASLPGVPVELLAALGAPAVATAGGPSAPAAQPTAAHAPEGAATQALPGGEAPASAEAMPEAPAGGPAAPPAAPAGSTAAGAERPAPVEAPVAAPAAAPATPSPPARAAEAPAPAAPPGPPSVPAARLSQAAESVESVLRIASARGITHARMALRPAELGGVEIRLRSSSAGVAAQVIAESPQAAEVLQQAGADLRRALEGQGVTVLSLDIALAGDRRSAQGGSASGERRRSGAGRGPQGAEATEPVPTTSETTLQLPNGVLVDVLA